MKKTIALSFIFAAGILLQCSDQGAKVVTGQGTIHLSVVDCFVIDMDHGERYEPRNLSQEFMQSDLRVRIIARIAENQASICQTGDIIDLIEIDRF
jgi:hypothetical protein